MRFPCQQNDCKANCQCFCLLYKETIFFAGGFGTVVIDSVRRQTAQTLAQVSKCQTSFALFIKDSGLPWTPSKTGPLSGVTSPYCY